MIQRLVRIASLQAGKVSAVLYGMMSLFFIPLLMLSAFFGAKNAMPSAGCEQNAGHQTRPDPEWQSRNSTVLMFS